jgi:2-phosphosulfolactate phosphatase
MKIDTYFTSNIPDRENQFKNSIVVMIDILRSGTSICAALYNGAKEIIPCETIDKAVSIFNSLDKDMRLLGGERNGTKPGGFELGNSPFEYNEQTIKGKIPIITTTNGTQIFNKAKDASISIIGGFVNFDISVDYIKKILMKTELLSQNLFFLCAGNNGRFSYEDSIGAGAFIASLIQYVPDCILTDASKAALSLFDLHKANINEVLLKSEHSVHLQELGFGDDVTLSLSQNIFPVLPVISGNSIKKIMEY